MTDWRTKKGSVPVRYWVLWWTLLVIADLIFYVLLTPIWIGLRVVAWIADRRTRTSKRSSPSAQTR